MDSFVKIILALACILSSYASANAKDWQGIVPLYSIRADVIRLLNQCSEHNEACKFETDSEAVYILIVASCEFRIKN